VSACLRGKRLALDTVDRRTLRSAVGTALVVAATLSGSALVVSRLDHRVIASSTPSVGAETPSPALAGPSEPRWPTSIENRKILDQHGDVYLIRTFSSWGMASHLSNGQITAGLEGLAANGFNGVTVWIGGGANYGASWLPRYRHKATSQEFWTGTPWASPLGPAWASLDHLVAEAERLGMFVWMSLNGGFGSYGARADWETVTDGNMRNAGIAIATRYRSALNVGWHVMFDDNVSTTSAAGRRIEAFFGGVNDTEGESARPVRWVEVANGSSTHEQGWLGTPELRANVNSWYEYGSNSTEIAEAGHAEVTTVPVGDCEPPYDGAPHYGGNLGQQLRERSYATFIEGGSLINYGHEDWWRFGLSGLYTANLTWQQVQAHAHSVQQSHAWRLLDEFVADRTWVPDDGSFLAAGTGSGDTKAAAGRSPTAAVAYFPSSRSVVIDTTAISGTNPVRLRWYDPATGRYTVISASEAQRANRSLSYPSAHADGSDWVLVVDQASGAPVPPTTPPTTIPSSTTVPPPPIVPPTKVVPTAARSLIARAGNRAARLSWLAPSSNGGAPITDYVIQRSADGGRSWSTISGGVSTARTAIAGGLRNGQRYRFRVAAVNRVGRGPWSTTVSAVPATTPRAPRQLTGTRAHRAVRLTWLAPRWNGGAMITDYRVQRSADGGRTWRRVHDGVSRRRATTVTGLTAGEYYRFRVRAKNLAGRGAWSAIVRINPK
jgi:Putative collagen-binding domain of a collagenase/Fibronectin type III domain/Protein of unknown function (DUF4038)